MSSTHDSSSGISSQLLEARAAYLESVAPCRSWSKRLRGNSPLVEAVILDRNREGRKRRDEAISAIPDLCYRVTLHGISVRAVGQSSSDGRLSGGKRGKVSGPSPKSKANLVKLFSTVDPDVYMRSGLYCVGTFPDEYGLVPPDVLKNARRALEKRLARAFGKCIGGAVIFWVVELQARKSGMYIGVRFPHLNLVVACPPDGVSPDDFSQWLGDNWFELVGMGLDKAREYGFKSERIYGSPRSLVNYLAGYVTRDKGITQADYDAYGWSGRWWGVIGRGNLSAIQLEPVYLKAYGMDAVALKRGFRSWLASKGLRGSFYARYLARDDIRHGFSPYGMRQGRSVEYVEWLLGSDPSMRGVGLKRALVAQSVLVDEVRSGRYVEKVGKPSKVFDRVAYRREKKRRRRLELLRVTYED